MGRGILAVIAGYAVITIVTMVVFIVIETFSPQSFASETAFPDLPVIAVILVGGFVAAAVGGYVAGLIKSGNSTSTGLALSALAIVLGIASAVSSPVPQPVWYQAGLILAAIGGISAGLYLRSRQLAR